MIISEIMDLADEHAKAYYMGRGEDTRKKLQAEISRLAQDRDEWKDATLAANENQRRADAKARDMQEQRDVATVRLRRIREHLANQYEYSMRAFCNKLAELLA